jgi:hypothetical protein
LTPAIFRRTQGAKGDWKQAASWIRAAMSRAVDQS